MTRGAKRSPARSYLSLQSRDVLPPSGKKGEAVGQHPMRVGPCVALSARNVWRGVDKGRRAVIQYRTGDIGMDLEQLNEIVKQANLRAIKKSLKAEGFTDCKRDRTLRHASLFDIASAPYEKTLHFPDGKGNEYVGDLCHDVKGLEQYAFVLIQFLAPFKRGGEDLSTKKMLIYAKPVNK